MEVFEMFTGCEMKNKYIVQNSMGQQVFYIKEDVDCCTRYIGHVGGSTWIKLDHLIIYVFSNLLILEFGYHIEVDLSWLYS